MTFRKCIDGPLKGEIFNVPEGRTTGFVHKRNGTGRYLPVGDDSLAFEYWQRISKRRSTMAQITQFSTFTDEELLSLVAPELVDKKSTQRQRDLLEEFSHRFEKLLAKYEYDIAVA